MRVAIATVQVPYLAGGAELLASGLKRACLEAGHDVDIITHPFRFAPPAEIRRSMALWETEDFSHLTGYTPERTICLKFPAYAVQAPGKVLWLLHQHRSVYDLWAEGDAHPPDEIALRADVLRFDAKHLGDFARRYSIAANVSRRLERFNGLASTPIYNPPALAERIYTLPAEDYVFFPSRLEELKRQSLLIEAMRYVRSPVVALLGGAGGRLHAYEALIAQHGLGDRVRLLGALTDDELCAFYAAALAVFYGPRDEDYGYVTLEAMLAAKPVLTCTDSGGPLEFVVDGETGFVVEPRPQAVAEAIDRLHADKARARALGDAGRARYHALDISWQRVLTTLLG